MGLIAVCSSLLGCGNLVLVWLGLVCLCLVFVYPIFFCSLEEVLTMQPRLNLRSFCLSFQGAEIKGVCHHI